MPSSRPLFDPDAADITVERRGRVVRLVIDRPAESNRLTPDTLAKFEVLARDLARDEETQVVIITGTGAHFSVGIFNPVLRASYSKDEVMAIVRTANRAYDAIEALPQTVIAALNGTTRAGGAELALACDIRLAADSAVLSFPEAAWGGFPGAGGPARLGALLGRGRALEIIGTGREVGAAEMERLGLVQAVHPAAGLAEAVEALADRIAGAGPLAMRGAKRIIRMGEKHGPAAAAEMADALRYPLEWSADVDEAMAAHRENRAPKFTGR